MNSVTRASMIGDLLNRSFSVIQNSCSLVMAEKAAKLFGHVSHNNFWLSRFGSLGVLGGSFFQCCALINMTGNRAEQEQGIPQLATLRVSGSAIPMLIALGLNFYDMDLIATSCSIVATTLLGMASMSLSYDH
ncbi:MAG: hypothetical protein JSS32_05980 [Verrucomicrobia bacterium]|nr:hypothetical protein [Verrucomicrobiota bacterium]